MAPADLPVSSDDVAKAIDRFLEAATVLGHPVEVRRFPEGTKTAQDAARAVGCDVGQIVKSLVFMAEDRPVLVLTSGANRVDLGKLGALAGVTDVRRATPEEARAATGFAVGGTPPFGHPQRLLDVPGPGPLAARRRLGRRRNARRGLPRPPPSELARAAGAELADVREDPAASAGSGTMPGTMSVPDVRSATRTEER